MKRLKRRSLAAAGLFSLAAAVVGSIAPERATAAQPVVTAKCRITFPSPLLIRISGTLEEVLIDPTCQHVYITNNSLNRVEVVSLQTGRLSAPINVGSSPVGLDITPDGSKLYVATSGANFVSVVNTATGMETGTIPVPPSPFINDTPWSIAIANNGLAFLSTTFAGSGFGARMLQLNLATNAVTPRTDFYSNGSTTEATMLRASPDKSSIGIVAGDISSGPVFTYSAASNHFSAEKDLNAFVSRVSTNGSVYLVGNFLLNANLLLAGTFASSNPVLDSVVDPGGKVGYRTSAPFGTGGNSIDVLDLTTVLMTGSLPVGDTFGTLAPSPPVGHMSVSSDGSLIAVTTDHGVALVQPHPIHLVPFAAFDAAATITLAVSPNRARVDLTGEFVPGSGSAGIALDKEALTLALGSYALTIPAGGFKQVSLGHWAFSGTVGTVAVNATLHAATSGEYEFEIVLSAVDLRGSKFPLAATLTIGRDDGSLTLDHGTAQVSDGGTDDND